MHIYALALLLALGLADTTPAKPPIVEHWNLPGVSSPMWESHPALDPLTGDLWFVRSDKAFSGWRILTSHCEAGRWSKPVPMPFASRGLEADPYFTPDGYTVYFISTRTTGTAQSAALDIWVAHRDAHGKWGAPARLPAPVNSDQAEWFPRPASDGWLYFGSRRAGGMGKDDIWRTRKDAKGNWMVENAGAGLNSAGAEYEFQPSPDGQWGVLSTDEGLFRVEKGPNGWRRSEKFGPAINANATGIGPLISPDGQAFVFSRDTGEALSGELFVARFEASAHGNWPPRCSAKAASNARH